MPSIAARSIELTSAYAAGSSAFAALIWWVVPATGLLGGIAYVVWVSKFKRKFESETSRSVGNFQKFQDSFRKESSTQDSSSQDSSSQDSSSQEPPTKPAAHEKPDFLG
jgi:hypothetical protein